MDFWSPTPTRQPPCEKSPREVDLIALLADPETGSVGTCNWLP